MEFAGKHLSTHNALPRAKAAVVDIITSEKAPREKASWVWNYWRKSAGIQSTVRLERCDLIPGRLQRNTGIWKIVCEETAAVQREGKNNHTDGPILRVRASA